MYYYADYFLIIFSKVEVYQLPSHKYLWSTIATLNVFALEFFFFFATELVLEPQLPDKDFIEKSEQPIASENEQLSCRVLAGDTSDEVTMLL